MGTPSSIAVRHEDNTVTAVYVNWDGYPGYVGKMLFNHYDTEEKIRELISYGSISSLRPEIGIKHPERNPHEFGSAAWRWHERAYRDMTTFHARDCEGDMSDCAHQIHADIPTWLADEGQDWNYLWTGEEWLVNEGCITDYKGVPVFDRLDDILDHLAAEESTKARRNA